ncbi:MAG: peroxiredoxin [Azoarcus sp.]|jgi:peroxiredoxin Q/BCP|nr:peroxiredoxin [Azoarcus sp.]
MTDTSLPALPDPELPATGGKSVKFSELRGKKLVLYFYPKDNTPGCTNENRDFGALYADFTAAGCVVFGISRDSLKSHDNFKAKLELPFDLLSDADEAVCQAFQVIKMKTMCGRQVRGIERSTFVFGVDGKLARAWRGVKVPGHAQEVLAFARTL